MSTKIDGSNGVEFPDASVQDTASIPDGEAKAWVNFVGDNTVVINESFNVSSITDLGTGLYTVNFSPSLGTAHFVATTTSGRSDAIMPGSGRAFTTYNALVGSITMANYTDAGTLADAGVGSVTIHSN